MVAALKFDWFSLLLTLPSGLFLHSTKLIDGIIIFDLNSILILPLYNLSPSILNLSKWQTSGTP